MKKLATFVLLVVTVVAGAGNSSPLTDQDEFLRSLMDVPPPNLGAARYDAKRVAAVIRIAAGQPAQSVQVLQQASWPPFPAPREFAPKVLPEVPILPGCQETFTVSRGADSIEIKLMIECPPSSSDLSKKPPSSS